MAKTKTMVLVFGFSSCFLPVCRENVVLGSAKSGFGFWFQFLPEKGVGVLLPFP